MEQLINIQNKLNAPKNQRNNFGGFNYRSAEDILEALKPILKDEKCALTIEDDIIMLGDKEDLRFYIKATATLYDDLGQVIATTKAFAREPLAKKGMDEPQITGTASSYARKYALNGLFCIDDNKDSDTDEYQKQTGSSVEDIISAIKEKMTLDNWKGYYKRAIELYPKGTEEYKAWIEAFNETKAILENTGSTPAQYIEDVNFLKEF